MVNLLVRPCTHLWATRTRIVPPRKSHCIQWVHTGRVRVEGDHICPRCIGPVPIRVLLTAYFERWVHDNERTLLAFSLPSIITPWVQHLGKLGCGWTNVYAYISNTLVRELDCFACMLKVDGYMCWDRDCMAHIHWTSFFFLNVNWCAHLGHESQGHELVMDDDLARHCFRFHLHSPTGFARQGLARHPLWPSSHYASIEA